MRLDTFASGEWPHEGRAGWNVTPDKLAAAGFYYTPEFPRDDTATCAFCGYALGDWEADDEPIAEHSRRSADCLFFRLNDAPAADESAASLATPEEGAKRRSEAVHVVVSDSESESGVSDTSKRQRLSAANKGASHASPANGAEARGSPADKLEAHSSPSGRLETDGSLTDGVEAQGSSSGRLETYSSPTRGISSEKYADEISESDGSELEAERGAGAEEAAVSVMPPADKVSETQPTETQPTETQLTDTQVDTAPASPGNMVIDEIAHNEESTQQSAQIEAGNEWDMDSDEEEMTVEEFIRACCDQKIAALEASAGQMVDAFMKRAEGTRERICSLTW
ncbi:hypothetical protein GGF43_003396 [Coemansia sp. RSA 2618]|nr:hypothetical protein GGF43_003396 [Coemansia sp. RSA 2618]